MTPQTDNLERPTKARKNAVEAVRAIWRTFEGMTPWRAGLLIFIVGLVVRAVLIAGSGSYEDLERYEVERTAISLAHHGTLADPYLIPTGPTAHAAPGYPILLAAIFYAFGTGITAEIVKQLCSAAVASAQYALLPFAADRLNMGRRAGLLAGIAGAIFPLKYSTEVLGDWEAPYAALALLLLVVATATLWKDLRFKAGRAVRHGLGWGVSLLTAPALMPIMLALYAAGAFVAARGRFRRYVAFSAAVFLTAALCMVPWALRNKRLLGSPIATRSNFGLELQLSNNGMATPQEPLNYRKGVYDAYHPLQSLPQAEAVRKVGEVEYNREKLALALAWTRSHPGQFAKLTALRFFYTWFPNTGVPVRDITLALLTLGMIGGIVELWKRHMRSALLLACCIAAYTPLFYLIHVNVRHRYPIDWIILLASSYFVFSAAGKFFRRRRVV